MKIFNVPSWNNQYIKYCLFCDGLDRGLASFEVKTRFLSACLDSPRTSTVQFSRGHHFAVVNIAFDGGSDSDVIPLFQRRSIVLAFSTFTKGCFL